MTYIIENANVLKHNQLVKTSMLVDHGKILSVKPSFPKYQYMKMNAETFLMTSTHVFYTDEFPERTSLLRRKQFFIEKFLFKGCTTVLVSAKIKYLFELEAKVQEIREFYGNSPLDFTIALQIPIENLTVPLIHQCKRAKIPAIFIEVDDRKQLYKIPWGWIREALFPYNCPFIPVINHESQKQKYLSLWQTILQREKIPFIGEPLEKYQPLPMEVLKKIGIYPLKGYLQVGGELSYNLYVPEPNNFHEPSFINDGRNIAITVHKGDIIRVKNKIYYYPKKGEEVIIHRPSFFQ